MYHVERGKKKTRDERERESGALIAIGTSLLAVGALSIYTGYYRACPVVIASSITSNIYIEARSGSIKNKKEAHEAKAVELH